MSLLCLEEEEDSRHGLRSAMGTGDELTIVNMKETMDREKKEDK